MPKESATPKRASKRAATSAAASSSVEKKPKTTPTAKKPAAAAKEVAELSTPRTKRAAPTEAGATEGEDAAGPSNAVAAVKPRRSSRKPPPQVDWNAPPREGCVIYIGHIPHGFYEEQMRGFFSQFGIVTRVRLSRSKKTGKSKHFAFVEFKHKEVAAIAAEAMNNYLMLSKILKVHVMPSSDLHPKMFVGANRVFKTVPWGKVSREQREKERTPKQAQKRVTTLTKKDDARRAKIQAAGMDYEFDGYAALVPAKRTKTRF